MIKSLIAIAALAIVASPVAAVTITFDDVTNSGGAIQNGYEGLNWSNFYTLDAVQYQASGYKNDLVSLRNVAFNAYANVASISSSTAFTMTSGFFAGAWNDGLTITLTGTLGGHAVYTQSFVVNTTSPTFEVFNHGHVDNVVFSSSGGTDNPNFRGGGTHFALDNLTVNGAVPEPASWAMMIAGFALVGSAMRRRTTNVTFA